MLKILLEKKYKTLYVERLFVDMELRGISDSSVRNIIYSNYEVLLSWIKHVYIIPFWIFFLNPIYKLLQMKIKLCDGIG